jgi:sugar phosphate permease
LSPGQQYEASTDIAEQTQRKITLRLMPFLFVLYIVSYLDRVNLAYASLEMTRELGFSNEVFGFGAGFFGSVA